MKADESNRHAKGEIGGVGGCRGINPAVHERLRRGAGGGDVGGGPGLSGEQAQRLNQ